MLHNPLLHTAVSLLVITVSAITAQPSQAADHFVPSGTAVVDCETFGGGVEPGDTITLQAGERGPLAIRNCRGTASRPIIVRNQTGANQPVVIRRTSPAEGGFVFDHTNNRYYVVDGSGGWQGSSGHCGAWDGQLGTNCGIQIKSTVSGDAPSAYFKMRGLFTNVTVRGVLVDGGYPSLSMRGIGFDFNDNTQYLEDHPGFWREDVLIEQNVARRVGNSGFYLGPNWRTPRRIPLRNWEVRGNYTADTGRNGIKIKSALEGVNWIHHNVIARPGLRPTESSGTMKVGIQCTESTCIVSHNLILHTPEAGIAFRLGSIPAAEGNKLFEAYNNVVVEPGRTSITPVTPGYGISSGRRDSAPGVVARVYNNTIIQAASHGIRVNGSVDGEVRDNIVITGGGTAISADVAERNNLTTNLSGARFLDAGQNDYRLTESSPARNAGSSNGYPSDDFSGTPRPQEGAPDIGAFEYGTGQRRGKRPQPPGNVNAY